MAQEIKLPEIYQVTSNTKHVGKGSTFVAVKGMKEDGVNYIKDALQLGASTIIVQRDADLSSEIIKTIKEYNASLIYEDNTRKALAVYSAKALDYPAKKLKILGVTGTKGKTTTCFLIEHILKEAGYKTALLGTVKNRILEQEFPANLTTAQPDYLHVFLDKCVKNNVDYVVMEVAAQAMSLYRVFGIEFDGVIFTNFSIEHAEFYKDMDQYFNAKVELLGQCKPTAPIILNFDDEKVIQLSQKYANACGFSLKREADVFGEIVKSGLDGLNAKVYISNNTGSLHPSKRLRMSGDRAHSLILNSSSFAKPINNIENNHEFIRLSTNNFEQIDIEAPALVGTFNMYNILSAISLLSKLGLPLDIISKEINSFGGVPGRLQRHFLPNGATAFIDYAHNPSSFEAVLSTLRDFSNNMIVVFGAGGDRDKSKRPLMGAIASSIADQVILTSDNPRSEEPEDIIEQIKIGVLPENLNKINVLIDRELAIKKAYSLSNSGSMIIILGKGPDEYQIVKGTKTYFSEAQILRSL